jgi:hypothetical protein
MDNIVTPVSIVINTDGEDKLITDVSDIKRPIDTPTLFPTDVLNTICIIFMKQAEIKLVLMTGEQKRGWVIARVKEYIHDIWGAEWGEYVNPFILPTIEFIILMSKKSLVKGINTVHNRCCTIS